MEASTRTGFVHLGHCAQVLHRFVGVTPTAFRTKVSIKDRCSETVLGLTCGWCAGGVTSCARLRAALLGGLVSFTSKTTHRAVQKELLLVSLFHKLLCFRHLPTIRLPRGEGVHQQFSMK